MLASFEAPRARFSDMHGPVRRRRSHWHARQSMHTTRPSFFASRFEIGGPVSVESTKQADRATTGKAQAQGMPRDKLEGGRKRKSSRFCCLKCLS